MFDILVVNLVVFFSIRFKFGLTLLVATKANSTLTLNYTSLLKPKGTFPIYGVSDFQVLAPHLEYRFIKTRFKKERDLKQEFWGLLWATLEVDVLNWDTYLTSHPKTLHNIDFENIFFKYINFRIYVNYQFFFKPKTLQNVGLRSVQIH